MKFRSEQLWGAQTQRSLVLFPIEIDRFQWGRLVIRALGVLKKCAALANQELQMLPSQGNFQLNVYKTIILHNVLESIQLLAQGCRSFHEHCIKGIVPNERRIKAHLDDSLMLVTALSPKIGYENAARISMMAYHEDISLREAALKLGLVTAKQFDEWVRPEDMMHPLCR